MTRVLVLGAAGFLGSHTLRALESAGATAVAGPPQDRLDLTTAEETDIVALLRLARPGVVVNATGRVAGSPEDLDRGNADAVRRLTDACARALPGVRFVHLGSLAEYGPGTGGPLTEDGPAEPVSPYGRAKLRATVSVVEASDRGDVDGTVLRLANPVGAGQPDSSLIGAVIRQLRAGGPGGEVTVGPLDGRRDFVSAGDVGTAVAAAALSRSTDPRRRLVNVGTGEAQAVRDVVRSLLRLSGGGGRLIEGTHGGSERSAAVRDAIPDVHRAALVLGWRARDGIEQALRDALNGAGPSVLAS